MSEGELCSNCGACCMAMNSPPFLFGEEYDLPPGILESYNSGMDRREKEGRPDGEPCFWLDEATKRCSQYEYRPDICRELPVGGEGCKKCRELLEIL